ncbi:MAG: hypothetical protein PHI48_07915 [Bacteroidales bacterium]|nr:hypothetical protein [Bacteroidales bacterium]
MAVALGVSELLIMIVVPILILFLIREIVCWYAKINQRVELMKEQNALLKSSVKEMSKITQSIMELSNAVDGVKSNLSEAIKPVVTVEAKAESMPMAEQVQSEVIQEDTPIFETEVEDKKTHAEKKIMNPYGMELSKEELEQVEEFIKQDLIGGEQVVISKRTRKVARFGIENWKCVDPTEWFILYEKPE